MSHFPLFGRGLVKVTHLALLGRLGGGGGSPVLAGRVLCCSSEELVWG